MPSPGPGILRKRRSRRRRALPRAWAMIAMRNYWTHLWFAQKLYSWFKETIAESNLDFPFTALNLTGKAPNIRQTQSQRLKDWRKDWLFLVPILKEKGFRWTFVLNWGPNDDFWGHEWMRESRIQDIWGICSFTVIKTAILCCAISERSREFSHGGYMHTVRKSGADRTKG